MMPPPVPKQFERYIFAWVTMTISVLSGMALGMILVFLVRGIINGVHPLSDETTDGFGIYLALLILALFGGYFLGMRVWIRLMRQRLPREAVLFWVLFGQPEFIKRYFENVVEKVFEDDATPG